VWEYGSGESFSAFRALSSFGGVFLPTVGIAPEVIYVVTTYRHGEGEKVLYRGTSNAVAKAAEDAYNRKNIISYAGNRPYHNTARLQSGPPTLPEGKFRLVKTSDVIMVVPGEDSTNRCLLFVANKSHGKVSVLFDGTTGTIIKECHCFDGNAVGVIALLEPDQAVAFHDCGSNEVRQYTWSGSAVESKRIPKAEWDVRNIVASPPSSGVEVL